MFRAIIPALAGLAFISACQTTEDKSSDQARPRQMAQAGAPHTDAGAPPGTPAPRQLPPLSGPKRTVAVGKFDAIGAFTAKYGEWDIGGGLAAMLTTALAESGRFVVVERANLAQVLGEQELKAGGIANPETGPQLGRLTGVQLLIYASVTEFGHDEKGGGFSFGFSGARIPLGLAQQSTTGTVGMDIRVVDTTSGVVLETHRVRESIASEGWDISTGYKGISIGTNQFEKTPLGQASRSAITRAVEFIAVRAEKTPWTGNVVEYDGKRLFINAGERSDMKVGDQFMIERVVKVMTDPSTGEALSVQKEELGVLRLTKVEERISSGNFTPLSSKPPKRGDSAQLMGR